MRIKAEFLGKPFKAKAKNGNLFEGVFQQDSREYSLYKILGFGHIFEVPKKAEVKEFVITEEENADTAPKKRRKQ